MSANEHQVGGRHYMDKAVQPWDAMASWMSLEAFRGFLRGNAIKYMARYDDKGGLEDLRKARHYLDKLIESYESAKPGIIRPILDSNLSPAEKSQPVTDWQPIETAPRDKRLLVWSGQEIYAGHWAQHPVTGDEAWVVAQLGDGEQAVVKATNWAPLPEPPQSG